MNHLLIFYTYNGLGFIYGNHSSLVSFMSSPKGLKPRFTYSYEIFFLNEFYGSSMDNS